MTKNRKRAIALNLLYDDDFETKTAAMYILAGNIETLVDAQNSPPTDEELAEWAKSAKKDMARDGLMEEFELFVH